MVLLLLLLLSRFSHVQLYVTPETALVLAITFFFFWIWQQKQSNQSKLERWDSIILHSSVHQNEVKSLSCVPPHGLYNPWNSLGQNTWVGSCSLLQGTFPTQGSDPGLPHCRQILYQLSHKGSPRILEWVACPFSRGSFWPRNWTKVSCIVGRFFTNWAIREDCTANESIQKMKRKSTISDNNLQTTHTQRVSI